MADDDFHTVSFLFWISTMEILAEGSLNASTVLVKLLHRMYIMYNASTVLVKLLHRMYTCTM